MPFDPCGLELEHGSKPPFGVTSAVVINYPVTFSFHASLPKKRPPFPHEEFGKSSHPNSPKPSICGGILFVLFTTDVNINCTPITVHSGNLTYLTGNPPFPLGKPSIHSWWICPAMLGHFCIIHLLFPRFFQQIEEPPPSRTGFVSRQKVLGSTSKYIAGEG